MFNLSRSVCFGTFLSASCVFGATDPDSLSDPNPLSDSTSLPDSASLSDPASLPAPNPLADLPPASYIQDLSSFFAQVTDQSSLHTRFLDQIREVVKVTSDDSGSRTLTLNLGNEESSIREVDKYLDLGFDIVRAGVRLALIPAKRKHIVSFFSEYSEDDADYEQLIPSILDRDLSLPETCFLNSTKYIEENELLITHCKKDGGLRLQKNILTSFKPGYYENLANLDGTLSFTNDAIQKDACKESGGRIERVNNGLGTAICNGNLNEEVKLPEGVIVAGYDVLHDVLYAYKPKKSEAYKLKVVETCNTLIGNTYLYKKTGSGELLFKKCLKESKSCDKKDSVAEREQYELVSPKKCIDEGLKIEVVARQLVCVQ